MSLFNRFFKTIFYVLIYAWTLIQSYLISSAITSIALSLIMAITSAIGKVPNIMVDKFWLVLIISSIPLGIVFFLMVIFDFLKRFKK